MAVTCLVDSYDQIGLVGGGIKSLPRQFRGPYMKSSFNTLPEERTRTRTRDTRGSQSLRPSEQDTARYPTQRKNSPFELIQNHQMTGRCTASIRRLTAPDGDPSIDGVSKAKRGYRWGYKSNVKNWKPSIHAGFKPSFN